MTIADPSLFQRRVKRSSALKRFNPKGDLNDISVSILSDLT